MPRIIAAMLASDAVAAATTWRPQLFGSKRAASIEDPIVEPLWTGPRVLAFVSGTDVRLTDVEGDEVTAHDDIREQLVVAAGGGTLLFEAALSPEPLQGPADVAAREKLVMPKASTSMTAMVIGDRGNRKDRLADRVDEVQRRTSDYIFNPVALVAVDLLWLDDESICDVPLLERRRLLESVLAESRLVRVGIFVKPPVDAWLGGWRTVGFTRLAFKGANSRYIPGAKNDDWAIAEIPRR
jgi:hypothetical protein